MSSFTVRHLHVHLSVLHNQRTKFPCMDLLQVPGWRCVLGTVLKFHKSYILLSRNPDKTCSVASPWRPHSAMGMWASELDQRAMGDVGFCGLVFLSRRKRARRKTRWCLVPSTWMWTYHLAKHCGRAETGFHGKTVCCWLCPLQQTHKKDGSATAWGGWRCGLGLPDPTDRGLKGLVPQPFKGSCGVYVWIVGGCLGSKKWAHRIFLGFSLVPAVALKMITFFWTGTKESLRWWSANTWSGCRRSGSLLTMISNFLTAAVK